MRPRCDLRDPATLRLHVDALYEAGLTSRSIARHIATLRNLFKFLLEKGIVDSGPTSPLVAPRQWQRLPKYLYKGQLDPLVAAPDRTTPEGVRVRAILIILYT